jgi:cytochrome c553
MKRFTMLIVATVAVAIAVSSALLLPGFDAAAQNAKKPQDTFTLAQQAKLGPVAFSHLDHTTKNRNVEGTGLIACVECHHTAQPASEVAKHPPHKTAWPADRTTTLTADLLEKDPSAPAVNVCTDCHARAGTKPKLLPEIPTITVAGAAQPVTLDNQQAFHRNCGGCHDEVAKTGRASTGPTSKKCMACHKKAAA